MLPAAEESTLGLDGDVVLPGDGRYDNLRKTFVHAGYPALIVRCGSVGDVQQAIAYARKKHLVISVRSGGHSSAGYGTNDGGIVIDLSPMNTIEMIDADRNLVRIAAGARWIDVASALAPYDLAISSGDTTTVGVGGLLVGGGIGWMVRKFGLAIDSVVGADVVTTRGDLVRASADENTDLFWAVRGGGGNFGIVTHFDVVAHPTHGVHFGTITYPAAQAATVIKGWSRYMRTATEDLTTTVEVFPSFGQAPSPVVITVCHADDDGAAADRAIQPLLGLGDVESQDIRSMSYVQVLQPPSELPLTWQPWVRNAFLPACTDEVVDVVTTQALAFDALYVQYRAVGGAVRRVPAEATAFAHRDAEVMLLAVHLGAPDDHLAVAPALRALWDAMARHSTGAYSGFFSTIDEEAISAIYPSKTHTRLARIKQQYDPENLLNQNPNVPPE